MIAFPFDKKYVLSGYGFDENGPYLRLDDADGGTRLRYKFHIRNNTFTIRNVGGRRCLGTNNLASLEASLCPDNVVLDEEQSSEVCRWCFQRIGFNPAFYNQKPEDLSNQQRVYNEESHYVYLAYFGAAKIKVGISNAKRGLARLVEQGARLAVVLKTFPDAYLARDLEKKVCDNFSVQELVKNSEKLVCLQEIIDLDVAQSELLRTKNLISEKLGVELDNNEVMTFDEIYLGSQNLRFPLFDVSTNQPWQISGRGVGMVGGILIMEQGEDQYLTVLKKSLSYLVEITPEVVQMPKQSAQMGLF